MDDENLWYEAFIEFKFRKKDFIKIPGEKDLEVGYVTKRNMGTEIVQSLDILDHAEDIAIHQHVNWIVFSVRVTPRRLYDLDNLEYFLDNCDHAEHEYAKNYNVFREILIQYGFLQDWYEKFKKFKHFDIGEGSQRETYEIHFESEPMWIGNLVGVSPEAISIEADKTLYILGQHNQEITDRIERAKSDILPQKLFRHRSRNIVLKTDAPFRGRRGSDLTSDYPYVFEYPFNVFLKLVIFLDDPDKEQSIHAILKHIDYYWDIYQKRAETWWN